MLKEIGVKYVIIGHSEGVNILVKTMLLFTRKQLLL